ncbi:MAG: hypothetical protein OEX10_08635 [Candidatus Bathyarchaeota archaeon]|nr:hypothetical protein [Candidatus Bathyarchaeota archaeon]
MKMNKLLFVGYLSTLTVMMSGLFYVVAWFLFVVPYRFEPAEIAPETISLIPVLLMLEAMPLAIFTTLFLKKGGGLNYFETWNTGRKLRVSGILLLLGYTVATIPAPIDLLTGARFRFTEFGQGTDYNPLYMNPIYIGLALMVCGLTAFIYLWMAHHRKQMCAP